MDTNIDPISSCIVMGEFIAQKDRWNLRNEIIGKTVHGHAHSETKLDREKRMLAPLLLIGQIVQRTGEQKLELIHSVFI